MQDSIASWKNFNNKNKFMDKYLRFDQRTRIRVRLLVKSGKLYWKYDTWNEEQQAPTNASPETILLKQQEFKISMNR